MSWRDQTRAPEIVTLSHRPATAGSAVDALVVPLAEPGGTVLTGDRADIEALAAQADNVSVEMI